MMVIYQWPKGIAAETDPSEQTNSMDETQPLALRSRPGASRNPVRYCFDNTS